jgi:hypothetical protein
MSDVDLSTSHLKTWLEWGVEEYQCRPPVVKALIEEVLRERDRATKAEQDFYKKMSDLEIQRAKQRGQEKPKLQDGIRYSTPTERPLGPDGFPQRGIV